MSADGRWSGIPLRSAQWFDGKDEVALLHKVAVRVTRGRVTGPVIGLADTSSDLNPCNRGLRDLVEITRSTIESHGATAVSFPVMSLGEDLMKPSAMLYRNLVAMELEEMVRSSPLDALVIYANCDKSMAAALMAAASVHLPTLIVLGGARGCPLFRGRPLGSGTDVWRALEDRRTGRLDDPGWSELEDCLVDAGQGSCNTMGTASTMGLIGEALGLVLPGSVGREAGSTELRELAGRTGERILAMVEEGSVPSSVMTQPAWDNSVRIVAAVGGSTNAFIHLAAVAGRLGLTSSLDHVESLVSNVPLLADIEPSGAGLIQDFAAAGGLPVLMSAMSSWCDLDVRAADGQAWGELAAPADPEHRAIRSVADPVSPAPSFAVIRGSLAPDGSIIKLSAASPELHRHEGPAVVFTSYEDMRRRLDDPDLNIDPRSVLVVSGCGPVGVPGMPEWGMAPIPQKLAAAGVTDMLRVTDGRMSGTSFGTVVLHVAPEAAVGGPLALVRDGDMIRFDVATRRLDLLVPEAELAARRSAWTPATSTHLRGWPALYQQHVLQAPDGCDLDFLTAREPGQRTFVEPVVGRS